MCQTSRAPEAEFHCRFGWGVGGLWWMSSQSPRMGLGVRESSADPAQAAVHLNAGL